MAPKQRTSTRNRNQSPPTRGCTVMSKSSSNALELVSHFPFFLAKPPTVILPPYSAQFSWNSLAVAQDDALRFRDEHTDRNAQPRHGRHGRTHTMNHLII